MSLSNSYDCYTSFLIIWIQELESFAFIYLNLYFWIIIISFRYIYPDTENPVNNSGNILYISIYIISSNFYITSNIDALASILYFITCNSHAHTCLQILMQKTMETFKFFFLEHSLHISKCQERRKPQSMYSLTRYRL